MFQHMNVNVCVLLPKPTAFYSWPSKNNILSHSKYIHFIPTVLEVLITHFRINSKSEFKVSSKYHLNQMWMRLKQGFSSMWTENFQMHKLGLKKAEEPEIKLPVYVGSWRKQGSSRKIPTSASLTMLTPLIVDRNKLWTILFFFHFVKTLLWKST